MGSDVAAWCEQHLGSPVVERFFGHDHLSESHGLRLADGREVVLKIRGAQPRLYGCAAAHHILFQRGAPCPRYYVGPFPLSVAEPDRWVTAEEWVPGGEVWLGPNAAADYAQVLAGMVDLAPSADEIPTLDPPPPWLHWDHGDPHRVWPPPASDRWDPHRIEAEVPALVIEVARRTRARLLRDDVRALPRVVGHGDFEAQNMRWFRDESRPEGWRPVVHDWDSAVAVPEAVLAGGAAAGFVAPKETRLAALAESEQFLRTYAEARDLVWSDAETEVAWATGAWVAAYNAAFEHLKGAPGQVTEALTEQAAVRLDRAGAGPV